MRKEIKRTHELPKSRKDIDSNFQILFEKASSLLDKFKSGILQGIRGIVVSTNDNLLPTNDVSIETNGKIKSNSLEVNSNASADTMTLKGENTGSDFLTLNVKRGNTNIGSVGSVHRIYGNIIQQGAFINSLEVIRVKLNSFQGPSHPFVVIPNTSNVLIDCRYLQYSEDYVNGYRFKLSNENILQGQMLNLIFYNDQERKLVIDPFPLAYRNEDVIIEDKHFIISMMFDGQRWLIFNNLNISNE